MRVYLLQAAMGLGILLYEIAKTLLFFGIPILTIIWTLITINKKKTIIFSTSEVLKIVGRSFVYSIISIIVLTVAIILILLFAIDLTVS